MQSSCGVGSNEMIEIESVIAPHARVLEGTKGFQMNQTLSLSLSFVVVGIVIDRLMSRFT